ncbi:YraN family protein [Candidatus Roizmanbacteria bacterium]|nr:YraN family protein [Candidatus Roizmanbacteria bacterium]
MGETIAASFLRKKGYRIVVRNFRSRFGEIDIVASLRDKLSFFEVKARVGVQKGKPYEAVGYYKLQHLRRTVAYFLLKNKPAHTKLSIDVISIILDTSYRPSAIDHYENVCAV